MTRMLSTDSAGLYRRVFQCGESKGTIVSDGREAVEVAISSIEAHRGELEKFIHERPSFYYSLEPIQVDDGPEVVRLMAEASEGAGVGPMAAVAGVLADLAVEAMIREGARVAVVENGGEASAASDRAIDVALQAGDAPLSKSFGFRLEGFPIGVATSSGLFSHALSFGEAEAVTVFADNAGCADAAATAVGNVVRGTDERIAVKRGVDTGLAIEGVQGVFILYRRMVGMGGEVPKIIGVNPDETIEALNA
jgi:ApbE superfamily uncharacterized protein (UPF0280 family)